MRPGGKDEKMAETTILVADDESLIRKLIRDFLTRDGYTVLEAQDGTQTLQMVEEHPDIALIVLDVMMPGYDGYEVTRRIRSGEAGLNPQVPIIMLTAKAEERDELEGFSLGVDEYVTKPFSPRTLVARVQAVLRRSLAPQEEDRMEFAGIVIDKTAHTVTVDGSPVDLSFKEFELLTYFAENRNIALSREKILNHVWNYDYYGDARTIDTHVKKLRSKLGPKGELIKTIWGMGYKLSI